MSITAQQVQTACEQLRDELTNVPKTALIYAMGFDIIAQPFMAKMLAARLEKLQQEAQT